MCVDVFLFNNAGSAEPIWNIFYIKARVVLLSHKVRSSLLVVVKYTDDNTDTVSTSGVITISTSDPDRGPVETEWSWAYAHWSNVHMHALQQHSQTDFVKQNIRNIRNV